MNIAAEPLTTAVRFASRHWRPACYWLATASVTAELGVGGVWDIARIPSIRVPVNHLGYPSYFLVLLGSWKLLGAAALLVPRRPLLKEWAYAGAFFTYTGAVVSHLATGYRLAEIPVLTSITALAVASWALRPPSRRLHGQDAARRREPPTTSVGQPAPRRMRQSRAVTSAATPPC
jgi:DoxX-like family